MQSLDDFNPRQCISGKARRLNRLIANHFRPFLSPYKITDSQLSLLFMLSKRNWQQKDLAEMACLEKSTLNRNLTRLIERRFVAKTNFPIIEITPTGKAFVIEIIPVWEEAMRTIRLKLDETGETGISTALHNLTKST